MCVYCISGTPTASVFSEMSDLDATWAAMGGPFLSSWFGKAVSWIWSTAGRGKGDESKVSYLSECDDSRFSWMVLLIVASVFRVMWGRMLWHSQIRGRHICLLECFSSLQWLWSAGEPPAVQLLILFVFMVSGREACFWTMLRCTSVS